MSMSIEHSYISFYNWNMWLKHMKHACYFMFPCIYAYDHEWIHVNGWCESLKHLSYTYGWLVQQCSWRSLCMIKSLSDAMYVDLESFMCNQCMKWLCDLRNSLNMFRVSLWTTLVFMARANLVTKSSFECNRFDQVWTIS